MFVMQMLLSGLKTSILFCLLIVSGTLSAQPNLDALMETAQMPTVERANIQKRLQNFVDPFRQNKGTNDVALLRKVFRKTHGTFLHQYKAYSGFDQLFSTGRYDCLTATALFSYVLSELHFQYKIIETNYHIFLVVTTGHGKILLETTDRFGGLVTGDEAITARIQTYQRSTPGTAVSDKNYYHYTCNLYQAISPENLVGLFYYNQAVTAFNQNDWLRSASLVMRSHQLYESPRCEELAAIIRQRLNSASVRNETVQYWSSKLQHLQQHGSHPLTTSLN